MKKWQIGLIVLVVLGIVAYVVVGQLGLTAKASGSEAQPQQTSAVKAGSDVVADGVMVPARSAKLSMPAGGIVAEVLVEEGDQVQAGQALLRLSSARQAAGVTQAEAQLARAESALAQLKAGPRLQEVETAQAAVEAAQAQLARIQQGARPEEIAAAEAALAGAQASLQKVKEGPNEDAIVAAQAEVANAEAATRRAQAAYDRVKSAPYIGAMPESLALEQATNGYEAAKARLAFQRKGASAADVAAALSNVQRAQAQLDALKAPARAAEVAAAQSEIRRAEAQLGLIQAGARPETIAAAEADVVAAQAAVQQAQAALAETELRAPFAGAVAALNVKAGEQVSPGAPVAVLADFSAWQVETEDLTEIGVVRVSEGDTVTITVDAIPDLKLTGTVARIKTIGEKKMGDMTYTVVVAPDQHDARLRWNMTASVVVGAK